MNARIWKGMQRTVLIATISGIALSPQLARAGECTGDVSADAHQRARALIEVTHTPGASSGTVQASASYVDGQQQARDLIVGRPYSGSQSEAGAASSVDHHQLARNSIQRIALSSGALPAVQVTAAHCGQQASAAAAVGGVTQR